MNRRSSSGFTLIEVMIVVVIIAVLTSIAVPSYQQYVLRSRRADCQTVMLSYANALERRFTLTSSYMQGGSMNIAGFGVCPSGANANSITYNIVANPIVAGDGTAFIIMAAPNGQQAKDRCGSLTLTNAGVKDVTGTDPVSKCW